MASATSLQSKVTGCAGVALAAGEINVGAPGVGGGLTVRAAFCVVPSVPEIVAVVEAVTALVVTVKVALVAPAATLTLAGTLAAAALLESETTAPPVGAALANVTVPVEEAPAVTLVGLSESVERVAAGGGVTVNTAVRVTPSKTAEIVAAVEAVTALVATAKVALVAPAATVMLTGTVAAVELSESVTTAPPLGAALVNITVPVEEAGPTTLFGLSDRVEIAGGPVDPGVTVNVAVPRTPP